MQYKVENQREFALNAKKTIKLSAMGTFSISILNIDNKTIEM
jgi:hypothetical protein